MSESPNRCFKYAWVILAVVFLISFIVDGSMYSFGIVLESIKTFFEVTQDKANLIPSLNTGILFLCGPLVSALNNQFGTRPVVMVSSVVYAFCYVLSAFTTSIYQIIFLLGLIGGIAFGCVYLSSFIILVAYFNEKLGLANGIAMAGSGMGAFAMAPIVEYFVREFEWKMTLIFIGALTIQCCVIGALLRPFKEKKILVDDLKLRNESTKSLIANEKNDASEKVKPSFVQNLKNIFKEILDFRILREHKSFLLFCMANLLFCLVYFVPFIYIPIRAEQLKIENYPWLISIIGIINIPFRILFGFVCDRGYVKPIILFSVSSIVAALSTLVYYWLVTFWMQACFSLVFGISTACVNCVINITLHSIVEKERFNNAFGLLNMFMGLGFMVGPYLAGFISEYSLLLTFLITTFFLFLTGVLGFITHFHYKMKIEINDEKNLMVFRF